ncbi:zinc finger, CCHC-type containing protein [Tanacetum coccineum]
MAERTVKEMTTNFGKLDKFEGHDFRRWQKKMHFLLTTLKVVYVLTTHTPKLLGDDTVEAIRRRTKWENDDYICRGHILNGMSDSLFDIYQNVESAKKLWDSLESKNVMKQFNELLRILRQYTQHGLKLDESISVSSVIDKLPPSWKEFKHTLKHGKDDLSLVQLGCHLRIKESLRVQESDKGKRKKVVGPSVNMTKEGGKNKNNKQNKGTKHGFKQNNGGSGFGYYNNGMFMLNLNKVPDDSGSVYMSSSTVVNSSLWHTHLGHVHYERMLEISKYDLIPTIDENLGKLICAIFIALSSLGNKKAVVKLSDPKRKTLGEKGIGCIFVGYAKHSKAYRDDHSNDVPSDTSEPCKSKRAKKTKSYGSNFQLYLVERSRDQIGSQYSYYYSIEEDLRTYSEAMQSQDAASWKETIDDEIGSIMENNTWILSDLPRGCKPLGLKWIFKRKMKVDRIIDKFKARLVIQGFRQKEWINYFDTYVLVARITTVRLLLALVAIHNLVIHQMDVKTAFLNGALEEEAYIKQPEGFVMPSNEHKVCKLVKSLYGPKQAPKQWHQKFDEVMLSSGFLLNQSDKCVYSKFEGYGKGVIICLYVNDMLIFSNDQNQVGKTKKFLSSKFLMKDMREADVILDCSPVSTLMDPVEKLKPNTGKPVDQLEYSRAIGCLMYAMTSTRPDIAYVVGRLSRFTSNPVRQHWQAITRVFKYLKGTMNYGLSYVGYPSVLEAYSNASWINHVEDSSSTSGWVFLLGGGAISWASKKQTCITGSTMESEFVALAAAGKEAEWLRNLIHEIPIWPKPIAPISIRCDKRCHIG